MVVGGVLGLLVASSVATQGLERGEGSVTRLALVNIVPSSAPSARSCLEVPSARELWGGGGSLVTVALSGQLGWLLVFMALGQEDQTVGRFLFLLGDAGEDLSRRGGGGRRRIGDLEGYRGLGPQPLRALALHDQPSVLFHPTDPDTSQESNTVKIDGRRAYTNQRPQEREFQWKKTEEETFMNGVE